MKYLWFTLLVLGICTECNYSQNSPGQKASRKVLLTLQTGEKIMESESYFPLGFSDAQVYLVTRANNKIYVYENGQRRGPYKDTEEAGIKTPQDNRDGDADCSAYSAEQEPLNQELLQMTDEGQYKIKFNGKTFGPFQYLKDFKVYPDKSGFIAVAMDAEMKSFLITADGQNKPLEGDVDKIHLSPGGKKYVFAVKENPNFDPALLKMDFSKMSQDELMKFAKAQEEKAKNAGTPQAYVYTNNGQKFGPYEAQRLSSDNPTFTKTGGDNWIMILDNTLYINGTLIKKFDNLDLNTCHIWLSKDGKRYAIVSYDKIVFSDATSYPYPIKTFAADKDGKTMIKWVCLENEKDLVVYSREL